MLQLGHLLAPVALPQVDIVDEGQDFHVGLFALGVLSVLIMVGATAISVGSINMDSLYSNIEQSSTLYDVNGEKVDTLHYTQDRTITPISEMPDDRITDSTSGG